MRHRRKTDIYIDFLSAYYNEYLGIHCFPHSYRNIIAQALEYLDDDEL